METDTEKEMCSDDSIEYTTEELIELGKKRNVLKLAPPLYDDKQKTEQSETPNSRSVWDILTFNHIAIALVFTCWTQILVLLLDGLTTATALYLFLTCIVIQQVLCFLTCKKLIRMLPS